MVTQISRQRYFGKNCRWILATWRGSGEKRVGGWKKRGKWKKGGIRKLRTCLQVGTDNVTILQKGSVSRGKHRGI